MTSLWSLFLNKKDRPTNKWHNYFPVYEKYFSPYVNKPIVFLEIGCFLGGSAQMWKEYFGPYAKIVTIDIDPKCKEFEEDQIYVRIGDQSDKIFLQSLVNEFGKFDIVLDDGSHIMNHVRKSFDFLYDHVDKNGVYMVEDMHTSYWADWEGGLNKKNTFIEYSKYLCDYLNAEYTNGQIEENKFSKSTLGIHFYKSMVVFEKGECGPAKSEQRPNADAPKPVKKTFMKRLHKSLKKRRLLPE